MFGCFFAFTIPFLCTQNLHVRLFFFDRCSNLNSRCPRPTQKDNTVNHHQNSTVGRDFSTSSKTKAACHVSNCEQLFFFGEMQRFSKECCSNFCRESISPVFCRCAKLREAAQSQKRKHIYIYIYTVYDSGKIVSVKALRVGYETERFFHMVY